MISLSKTLFPVPLRPSTARVSPRLTLKLIPSRTLCDPKDLCTFSTATAGALSSASGSSCRIAMFSTVAIFSHKPFNRELWEDNENELDQHHVCQDEKERGQHNRVSCRASHTFCTAVRAHSLETCNEAND